MNLNYSILWYDDDKNFFESQDMGPIEEAITSWGFRPQIIPVHDAAELKQHEPFNQFDMLVVDLELGGNEHGAQFIKNVRDNNVFAEIIFYSMKGADELWQAIGNERLEGVFVAYKKGIEQKLIRVAHQSVRKVLDLENMRGIVMSEVGDLDALLEDIFVLAMNGITPEQQKKVFDRFHEKTDEQTKQLQSALQAFKDAPSIESLLELCDSDKRWQNFNRVKKLHDLLKVREIAEDYQQAILWPRNCLAHGKADRSGDGSLVFRHRGKEFTFNDEVGKTLRHKILEYKSAFSEIAEALNQQ